MSMLSAKCAIIPFAALLIASWGGASNRKQTTSNEMEAAMTTDSTARLVLTSSAFKEGEPIPQKYTCDGPDISPPLKWSNVPINAKSLALIVDDPDAPMGTWVHWVIFNMPPDIRALPENVPSKDSLPNGALQGRNGFRKIGYGGPCPPGGTHRYFFKLYALDEMLKLKAGCSKADLLDAMEGHILGKGELLGRYSR